MSLNKKTKIILKKGLTFFQKNAIIVKSSGSQALRQYLEKSPSPVYGARLELVYGLIAHRGFESLLLRQKAAVLDYKDGFLLFTSQHTKMDRKLTAFCPAIQY